jgi:hypothetical protein
MKRKKTKTPEIITTIFLAFLIYSVLIFLATLLFNKTSAFLYYWSLPLIVTGIVCIISFFVFIVVTIIDSSTKI